MASERPAEPFRARSIANPVAVILVCAIGLTFLGLTILFSASVSLKQDPYFYLDKQVLGVRGGRPALLPREQDQPRLRAPGVGLDSARLALLLLVLVLIPHLGVSVKGSRRWLGYGAARLQVSEFAKLAMVFCMAHYLALNQTRIGDFKRGYLYPLGIIGAFAGLILLEPDFGTAALALSVGLILLFLAGAKWRYILPTIGLSAAAFAAPRRAQPEPAAAVHGVPGRRGQPAGRHLPALPVAGGVRRRRDRRRRAWGRAASRSTSFPRPTRTSSSPSWARSSGCGSRSASSRVFAVIFVAGLAHLRRAPNLFHFLLAAGCLLLMCLQSIINLGVVTGVLPTKGMSLPFISAGLSNLLLMGLLVGHPHQHAADLGPGRARPGAGSMREVLA